MSDVPRCVRDGRCGRTSNGGMSIGEKLESEIDDPDVLRFDHDWVGKRFEAFNFEINFEESIHARGLKTFSTTRPLDTEYAKCRELWRKNETSTSREKGRCLRLGRRRVDLECSCRGGCILDGSGLNQRLLQLQRHRLLLFVAQFDHLLSPIPILVIDPIENTNPHRIRDSLHIPPVR
jgi:hypothetical protein